MQYCTVLEYSSERQFFSLQATSPSNDREPQSHTSFSILDKEDRRCCIVLQIIVDSETAKKKLAECPWAASSDEYNLLTGSIDQDKVQGRDDADMNRPDRCNSVPTVAAAGLTQLCRPHSLCVHNAHGAVKG
jgi:hypothetical protein